MIFKKLEKNYVSEIDRFLAEFDAAHPELSPSQQAEVALHQKIAQLRDKAENQTGGDPFDF